MPDTAERIALDILQHFPIQHTILQAWIGHILSDPTFQTPLDRFQPIYLATADPEDVRLSLDAGEYLGPDLLDRLQSHTAHTPHEHPLTLATDLSAAILAQAILEARETKG